MDPSFAQSLSFLNSILAFIGMFLVIGAVLQLYAIRRVLQRLVNHAEGATPAAERDPYSALSIK